MWHKILVPLDGSAAAEHALDTALRLQPQELLLLRVPMAADAFVEGEIAAVLTAELQDNQAAERAEAYLADVQSRLERPGLTIRTLTPMGDVAGLIIDTAEAEEVDLVVMSSHGRSALRVWMLGGVAERVLRNIYRPVLLVRQTKPLDRMVILLDGSPLAEQILPLALSFAEKLEMQVTFLNVSEPEIQKHAAAYLQTAAEKYNVVAQAQRHVINGVVAPAITEYVTAEQIPLLAMVTHGYSAVRRWAYGSVAEKVLRMADCSMLILRPPME